MANIGFLVGGAIINALVFSGSNHKNPTVYMDFL